TPGGPGALSTNRQLTTVSLSGSIARRVCWCTDGVVYECTVMRWCVCAEGQLYGCTAERYGCAGLCRGSVLNGAGSAVVFRRPGVPTLLRLRDAPGRSL